MCGGGSSSASDAAQQREDERQAEITRSTEAIDAAFGGRGAQQQEFVNSLREFLTGDVRRQQKVSSRRSKFALARSGLSGGSQAVDQGRTLAEEFTEGLLKAERGAQGGLADLKAQDEQARLQLLGLAQTGLKAGTAASRASEAIQSNLAGASARGLQQGIGDVFGKTANLFRAQEEAAARRRGLAESEVFADPFSR